MNKRIAIAVFLLGIIALAAWISMSLVWGNWGENLDRKYVLAVFYTIVGSDLLLLALGLIFREKDRWRAFTLAAVLLIGFGLSWIYSLGGFLWPVGVILLVVSLSKLAVYPRISVALVSGIVGGIWAIIPGLFSIVGLIFFSQPAGDASGLVRRFSILSIVIMLMGVLALIAISQYTKRPRFAASLIWLGIAGIILAFWFIAPGTTGIFVMLPMILLVPAAIKMSRAP